MIIVKLKGGLGNQMFQYACGRALSIRSGQNLYLDLGNYEKAHVKETPRTYSLYRFNIVGKIYEKLEARGFRDAAIRFTINLSSRIYRKIFKKYNIGFNQKNFDRLNKRARRGQNITLHGFWWSEAYFADVADGIRRDFTLVQRLSDVARVAENSIRKVKNTGTRTISIHIRRGDYVINPETNAYHGTCTKDYYETALRVIEQKAGAEPTHLFIFSDDIQWVKENMTFPHPTTYVSEPGIEDYEELVLMSQCANHIIANSSFSWWAAWLNPKPDKIVIAPQKWVNAETNDLNEILPEDWIRI